MKWTCKSCGREEAVIPSTVCQQCSSSGAVNLVVISGDLPLGLDKVPFRAGQVVRLERRQQQGRVVGMEDAWRAWAQFWNR